MVIPAYPGDGVRIAYLEQMRSSINTLLATAIQDEDVARYVTNYYAAGQAVAISTATLTNNYAVASPIVLPSCTLTEMHIEVTTAAASSAIRLGIYRRHATTGMPDALVLDAGTVDSTTTGVKSLGISQAVAFGTYWLLAVPQGGGPAVRSHVANLGIYPAAANALSGGLGFGGFGKSGITGALPSTFGTPSGVDPAPRIAVRMTAGPS